MATGVSTANRQARVYDTATGEVIATLDEAAAAAAAAAAASVGVSSSSAAGVANGGGGGAGGGEMVRGSASACFSPSGMTDSIGFPCTKACAFLPLMTCG